MMDIISKFMLYILEINHVIVEEVNLIWTVKDQKIWRHVKQWTDTIMRESKRRSFGNKDLKRDVVIQVIFEDENSFKEERDVRPK